ncbi:MAG: sigma-70 family RNA polymerase sigma factor [Rhodospirillaceae bacterium]|nr:sigma-70 family RNA polymerase sigma factor [Rhodospirillaceae bacterium]MDE0362171.1 sigma-70 family RNA polymerase sigma factor [Rhodospirillaceae bacterium]
MKSVPTRHELVTSLSGRHRELVQYLRLRLPSEEDAKDLTQEAYLRLLRLKEGHLIRNPEAYLFRIASNLVYEFWLEAKPGWLDSGSDPDQLPSRGQTPDELADHEQAMDDLKRALAVLPPLQRNVILLHRRDGKTYEEIARELGISRDMVKKHLTKALVRCRQYLILRQRTY